MATFPFRERFTSSSSRYGRPSKRWGRERKSGARTWPRDRGKGGEVSAVETRPYRSRANTVHRRQRIYHPDDYYRKHRGNIFHDTVSGSRIQLEEIFHAIEGANMSVVLCLMFCVSDVLVICGVPCSVASPLLVAPSICRGALPCGLRWAIGKFVTKPKLLFWDFTNTRYLPQRIAPK